ncbi:hypothetical protein OAG1_19890 [Agarivorans sp. OAG1]|uniref:Uncharacterized protein n=1 Tax=Agarivorans albus MKT 106 TaxID=1331007 RepID=R9PQC4_AGAAL|nr:hypothetical protein [Agarivorans albus]BEU03189.1 hypothetical protein OAG1_19890 [Agarivorans sp. OAG1]GAD03549.1 hypothetical protein AALB_3629 [Agarivorans albus MKT 106]
MQAKTRHSSLLVLAILLWPSIAFAYPGNLTTHFEGEELKATVTSNTDRPIRCQLSAGPDIVWMEIQDKQENFKFAKGYKTHHLSLYCKIIEQKTKARPWRLNPYNTPIPEWNKVIFPD